MTSNRRLRGPVPPWKRRQNVQERTESTETTKAVHRDPYATQIIDPALVALLFRAGVWTGLLISFFLSALGNTRPFGGDINQLLTDTGSINWTYLSSKPWLSAFGCAVFSQVAIQIAQFRFAQKREDWKIYWLLIGLSVLMSLYTFAPLLNLIQLWYKLGYVWIYLGAAAVLGLNDWMQEQALQKRG